MSPDENCSWICEVTNARGVSPRQVCVCTGPSFYTAEIFCQITNILKLIISNKTGILRNILFWEAVIRSILQYETGVFDKKFCETFQNFETSAPDVCFFTCASTQNMLHVGDTQAVKLICLVGRSASLWTDLTWRAPCEQQVRRILCCKGLLTP
jgi:hypothetical protein